MVIAILIVNATRVAGRRVQGRFPWPHSQAGLGRHPSHIARLFTLNYLNCSDRQCRIYCYCCRNAYYYSWCHCCADWRLRTSKYHWAYACRLASSRCLLFHIPLCLQIVDESNFNTGILSSFVGIASPMQFPWYFTLRQLRLRSVLLHAHW